MHNESLLFLFLALASTRSVAGIALHQNSQISTSVEILVLYYRILNGNYSRSTPRILGEVHAPTIEFSVPHISFPGGRSDCFYRQGLVLDVPW
jgi:hypothetical protein